jgi:DAK2 domain fusion protein YloV
MSTKIGLESNELINLIEVFSETLEEHRESINSLNVFPVPDGDTGTNMFFTIKGIREYISEDTKSLDLPSMVKLLSKWALLSARGNSGLLIAQLFKGLAFALNDDDLLGPKQFVEALIKTTEFAYESMPNPQEGTILTVLKESANASDKSLSKNPDDLIYIWKIANEIAKKTVDDTPNQMELLKKAGVVDAGGYGFSLMLEASYNCLFRDEEGNIIFSIPSDKSSYIPEVINHKPINKEFLQSVEGESWGFCTSFVIEGSSLDIDHVKADLNEKGKSLVITGEAELLKIHIHVEDSSEIIKYSKKYGDISHEDIQNMNLQTSEFNHLQDEEMQVVEIALIVFAKEPVLRQRFLEITPDHIEFIDVSEESSPSVQDILNSIEKSNGKNIILLPNDKNLIEICNQAILLTSKNVSQIPTKNFIEGISSVLTFTSGKSYDINIKSMNRAIEDIKNCSVKIASKTLEFNDLNIEEGDYIGFVENDLITKSTNKSEVLKKIISSVDIRQKLVTIYVGNNIIMEEALNLLNQLQEEYNEAEFDLIETGQYDSEYFIGIE